MGQGRAGREFSFRFFFSLLTIAPPVREEARIEAGLNSIGEQQASAGRYKDVSFDANWARKE